MKSKIKQLTYTAMCLLAMLMALPATTMAQRTAPPLSPKLQGYATAESNANWIDFREGTDLNAETIFKDLKKAFDLGDNDEMKVVKTKSDNLGMKHYRFQQYYKGYKVVFGEFVTHQDRDGFLKSANGRLITGLTADNVAPVNESAALNTALHFMNARRYLWQNEELEHALKQQLHNPDATYYPKGELVYVPNNYETFDAKDYRLAWCFNIYTDGDGVPKRVYVDAKTNQVIRHSDIGMVCSSSSGNTSAFNGNVTVYTENTGSSYRSHNDCQATDIYVYNCNGGSATNTFYTDADNVWNGGSTQQSAVQAMLGAQKTYDYYHSYHGRDSWDGSSSDMVAYNNAVYGNPATANNACWGCFGNNTIFGRGNTSAATDDWNTDDIMGHEFTHGVTQDEAGLDYQKESGGLNESYSDIFGEMVESWTEGNNDFLVGGDRGAIRSFINPNAYGQPDTYLGTNWYSTSGCTPSGSNDNCGVHTNSGVQNFWFYLISNGGTGTNDNGSSYNVTAIGRFKGRDIAYRALTTYETSSSQYIDAREATIRAAIDLYGSCSTEAIAVGDAWHAVGVESQSSAYAFNVCGTITSGGYTSPSTQAIHQLTGGNGCTNTVASPTDIRYYAARDRIILYPGFSASGRWIAYLEPCSVTRYKMAGDENSRISDEEKGVKHNQPVANAERTPEVELAQTGVAIVPNPFRSKFEIAISSAQDAKAQVKVYNSVGVQVMQNSNINLAKGTNKVAFDGSSLQKGVYLVEIWQGETKTVKKIVKL